MDKDTRNTIWLGLFVTIGLILLIIAVYFIGSKKNMFSSTVKIVASFSDVNGLQNGDAVRFRGITIGTVKNIHVQNDSVLAVVMTFDKNMQQYIKKNAIASITTDGLMGNKLLSIKNQTAQANTINENDTLKTLPPIDMQDITRKLAASNDKIAIIANNISEITEKIKKGKGTLGVLMMDTVFAKHLKRSVRNLEAGASNINQESEALKHNFLFRRFFKKKEKKK